MEWYIRVLTNNYANVSGRARRKEYWMFVLINGILMIIAAIFDDIFGSFPLIFLLYTVSVFCPSFAVAIRRLHDVGKSGWWLCIGCIPVIGSIWLLVLFCMDGNPGENRYGPSSKVAF